jgi:cytochrome c5
MTQPPASSTKVSKPLVIVVLLALVALIALAVVIPQFVTDGQRDEGEADNRLASRIQPAGVAWFGLAAPSGPKGPLTGEQVFQQACKACHEAGLVSSPKLGDKTAWAPRVAQGMDTLYASALKGKGAMPAKGGNLALSDADVTAAVDYMVTAQK